MDIAAASNFERLLYMRRAAEPEGIGAQENQSVKKESTLKDSSLSPGDLQCDLKWPGHPGSTGVDPLPSRTGLTAAAAASTGCERSLGPSTETRECPSYRVPGSTRRLRDGADVRLDDKYLDFFRQCFVAESVDDQETKAAIQHSYQYFRRIIDPHTGESIRHG